MESHRAFENSECRFASLATAYALGELRGRKGREFARHIEACPACRSSAADTALLLARLEEEARSASFRQVMEAPEELRERVLGELSFARRKKRIFLFARAAAGLALAGAAVLVAASLRSGRGGPEPDDRFTSRAFSDRAPSREDTSAREARSSRLPGAGPAEAPAERSSARGKETPLEVQARRAAQAWLLSVQEPDGSWSARRWGGHPNFDVGTTAMTVLALEDYPDPAALDAAGRGVGSIIRSQASSGRYGPEFVHELYNQGLACLALLRWVERSGAEAGRSGALGSLSAGLRYLAERQLASGGWGNRVRGRDATSEALSIWPAQALVAAEARGVQGIESAARAARRWLEQNAGPGSAERARRALPHLSLARAADQLRGPGADSFLDWREAARVLRELFAIEVPPVERGTRAFDGLLARQVKTGPLAGSWDPSTEWGPASGRVQATALAALVLVRGPARHER